MCVDLSYLLYTSLLKWFRFSLRMKSVSPLWGDHLPVRPVQVRAVHSQGKKISAVVFQDDLSLLAAVQVDPLDPVRTRVAPVQFIFLKDNFKRTFSRVGVTADALTHNGFRETQLRSFSRSETRAGAAVLA